MKSQLSMALADQLGRSPCGEREQKERDRLVGVGAILVNMLSLPIHRVASFPRPQQCRTPNSSSRRPSEASRADSSLLLPPFAQRSVSSAS